MSENETLVHGNLSKAKAKKGETPSIEFKYDEVTGELSFRSNGILVDKGYVSSHGLVTRAELEEALKTLVNGTPIASVTIYGGEENWKAVNDTAGCRYGQVVNVNNAVITPNSKVDLQLSSEQMAIFYEKDLAFVAENEDGVVTIYCIGQIPQNDYTIQATVTEVVING